MPYVKPTVHLSRIASTALKSFTHGYAQTVVAASQTSYAAQNTPTGPLADNVIARFRKSEKSRLQNVTLHLEGQRLASTSAVPTTSRPESSLQDPGLEKYLEAWQKHQRNGGTKEWQQFQFARMIEWQPPTTVPGQELADLEALESLDAETMIAMSPKMKRSYTTSAIDNFEKAFLNDVAAEAAALEQVNNAIAEEIQRAKEDAEDVRTLRATSPQSVSPQEVSPSVSSHDVSTASSDNRSSTPVTVISTAGSHISTDPHSEIEFYDRQLLQLAQDQRYADIPAVFQGMLLAGVRKPSQAAYRALLASALQLTSGRHLKVPKALEVYSDMLKRRVVPDTATYSILIQLLSERASESVALRKYLDERLRRYGGLDEAGAFMFQSSHAEYTMLAEDNSLSIALKMFDRATTGSSPGSLSDEACSALIIANAALGRVEDMNRVYSYLDARATDLPSQIFPSMITAYGAAGDLRTAVDTYDTYKDLAIANNTGDNSITRIDYQVYAALIKAYGVANRLQGGLKFLADIQANVSTPKDLEKLREVVALQAILPLALKDPTFRNALDLTSSLSGRALIASLSAIAIKAADDNKVEISSQAFDLLARCSSDLAEPSMALLAMHVRNAQVEAAEPFWRVLEAAPASLAFVEPTTMRALALIAVGQARMGLRQSRRMFARIRDAQPESQQNETIEMIDEAVEVLGDFMLHSSKTASAFVPEAGIELLRMMAENGGLVVAIADHVLARFGPDHIASLTQSDLELLTRVQAKMILDESSADIASPTRFGCLLETIIMRAIMPSPATEVMIEKTLVNIDQAELSRLWNSYRYPTSAPVFTPVPRTPVLPFPSPALTSATAAVDDAFDPYASRTDVKGSNAINELLERPQGRRLNDALSRFRNMRRVGRIPRMFTYGKLIEAAAKDNNLSVAHEVLEMAKQDVPFDARYRVVRFGWQQILDHMIAGCLNVGRRDLAKKYHQDILDIGAAPSANTFGLYITTLKENTKTFDEATEAVKIFLRAKAEGVEPSSFLYNALIGKLGKARRIDDCLFYFAEMRNLGIRPTSVTYGTIVNALCRVSDDKFAEEIFEEMEAATNYKPRPAPYHSLMQFFLTTKRDRSKVLAYYERMRAKNITPTPHTFKLLIDAHAALEPVDMVAAEAVLDDMRKAGLQPEAVHYASLIHAKGCVLHDLPAARKLFDSVLVDSSNKPQPCLYQALFESLNANHRTATEAEPLQKDMVTRGIEFTPYIANALIHGWTLEGNVAKARSAFDKVHISKREPSTYEAMVRAYLSVGDKHKAKAVVKEALGRGYPAAVEAKIAELAR